MGLLGIIRGFLDKIVKNKIKIGIVAYLIYRIIKDNNLTDVDFNEGFSENIIIKGRVGDRELIFDTVSKQWGVVQGSEIILITSEEDEARKRFKRFSQRINENVRLNKLYEKYVTRN